jgi:hypothetical protein
MYGVYTAMTMDARAGRAHPRDVGHVPDQGERPCRPRGRQRPYLRTTTRPELRRLCLAAVTMLHEDVEVDGLCVVCEIVWPCELARLA